MRLSDYVIEFLARQGIEHVFMVSGGGAMYLIDSLGRSKDIRYICNHHEQASAMAAEGYQRLTGNLGVALVTTGPAGTNAITGLLCAWNDSIPVLVISGQANSKRLIEETGLRQKGVHEADIVRMVAPGTKYAITIKKAGEIRYHLEKAFFLAKNGRPGPVWLDIPLDIQAAEISVKGLKKFRPLAEGFKSRPIPRGKIVRAAGMIQKSVRPVILAGHGIKLSGAAGEFLKFAEKHGIPIVTSKNAFDMIPDSHPLLAGRIGINGQRAGNFAVQNADLILAIGCRLAYPTIGYETELFGREARKIVVDVDPVQLGHCNVRADLKVLGNAREFITRLNGALSRTAAGPWKKAWLTKCQSWRKKYPAVTEDMRRVKKYVNSYHFFDVLSGLMKKDDVLVTDQGATFFSFTVAFKNRPGQHAFTNGGFSPMGYGLPAAIGACFGHGEKRVVCVHGEGGLELNVQELQTVAHYRLPIKLFVFNNQGYLSIKHTQQAYFNGRFVGSDPRSGLSCAETSGLAKAYKIPFLKARNHRELPAVIQRALSLKGPVMVEIILDPLQPMIPKVTSKKEKDGRMVSMPLEDMFPFLPRDEFRKAMVIKPVEEKTGK